MWWIINNYNIGPQISWQTVFILEYLGPLLAYPIFYMQPSIIYGETFQPMELAQQLVSFKFPSMWINFYSFFSLAFYCFMIHYLKREYETIFVHRFGNSTMPFRNLFKNSSYYWGNAILCSYFINRPSYTGPSDIFVYVGLAMFIVRWTFSSISFLNFQL